MRVAIRYRVCGGRAPGLQPGVLQLAAQHVVIATFSRWFSGPSTSSTAGVVPRIAGPPFWRYGVETSAVMPARSATCTMLNRRRRRAVRMFAPSSDRVREREEAW